MTSRDYVTWGGRVRAAPVGLGGGRGVHGPSPVSASLYRLRRQTALRGTVNPSSRRHVKGAERTALRGTGARRDECSRHPPTARSAWRGGVRIPPTRKSPLSLGAPVSGSTKQPGGSETMSLQKSGPEESSPRRRPRAASKEHQAAPALPQGEGSMVLRRTVCGEAVERSAGRRRIIDPSPHPQARKAAASR